MKPFLFIFFYFSFRLLSAQGNRDSIPLHYFLQQNFDTTIILSTGSIWTPGPDYHIISKKNNQLYLFTYRNPIGRFKTTNLPKQLYRQFDSRSRTFTYSRPDTNTFFLPYVISYLQETPIKVKLDSLHLWDISGDEKFGMGCPIKLCDILDSVGYDIFLVTHNKIKKVLFYDPEFYEKCCPGNTNRQTAIQLIQLMKSIMH